MSEKPASKPAPAKPANPASPASTKGAATTARSKPGADPDDDLDFLSSPQKSDEIGRLGEFRVLKVIGKGGMGTVFMAEDTRLHRIVALKVMLPSIAKKPIARDRFIREAQATAKIEHDHIITIYEVRGDTDVPYAAMQYLRGMSLDDWLRAGKSLNVPQIMRIGKEIAKGLAAAHARHLIHRDIKPSNIWLDASNKGRVKILDFGLARPTNEETHLTQEGMILGTPAYMSPEQARGQDVDERCDLFSLGCVLYRLCSGRLPFTGKDAMSMLLAITSEEPADLRPLNSELPTAFTDLVHKLLAKKPEDRPASAKDVVQAIQGIEREWIASGKSASTEQFAKTRAPESSQAPETIAMAKPEDIDPALEESMITDLELQEPESVRAIEKPRKSGGAAWIFAGLGGAAFAVLSILCCLGIALATNHGNIEIAIKDEAARKMLADIQLMVRDREHHKSFPVNVGINKLPAGDYKFDDTNLPHGLHIEPNPFFLDVGQTLEISIRYQPAMVLVKPEDADRLQKEWAAFLKRPVDEANSLDAPLTLIPPGEFYMGTSKDQLSAHRAEFTFFKKPLDKKVPAPDPTYTGRIQNETPQHRVRISKPFYMSSTEVTVGQFVQFVAAMPGHMTVPESNKKGGTGLDNGKEVGRKPEFSWRNGGPGYKPSPSHPVTNITWKDAEGFCAWLSKKEGKTYRLPTEAEWEYACRAGTSNLWSFGDDHREANAREYAWYTSPQRFASNPTTPTEVRRKKSNGFGLFDMHGNVAEMCADVWGAAYYELSVKDGLVVDPRGPDFGTAPGRVVRGGSFLDSIHLTRSAYRHNVDPNLGNIQIGFRVVCEIAE